MEIKRCVGNEGGSSSAQRECQRWASTGFNALGNRNQYWVLQKARNIQEHKQHVNMRPCYDCYLQKHSQAEVTNPSCRSGADLHQGSEQMCVHIHTDTHTHTCHTTLGPNPHSMKMTSAGKGADGVAGLGPGWKPRGSSFAPLM